MACKDSFEEYIHNKVVNLQLINVEDSCMGVAIHLIQEDALPSGVLSVNQLELIERAQDDENFEYDAEFIKKLIPVRDWLVKKICKAVKKKEIKPLVLCLFEDESVNPKGTYVSDHKIIRWLGYRGINAEVYNYEAKMWDQFEGGLNTISECIDSVQLSLSNTFNSCESHNEDIVARGEKYFDVNDIQQLEIKIYHLEKENDKLKKEKHKYFLPSRINKHKERHAINREQILGAALSLLARYPEQCRNKAGNLEATKIRVLIEEKALLFWPETGEPVLGSEVIERLIREWLKKTGE